MNNTFQQLDDVVNGQWAKIKKGTFWSFITEQGINRDLYFHLMAQIYHYTKYNSMNQAIAAYTVNPEHTSLLKFVYRHALEELGHEKMVLHDLESIGIHHRDIIEGAILPATHGFIGYLYSVSLQKGAVARLGYSYWAENAYEHLDELLKRIRLDLRLDDQQMTFFVSHKTIDAKHSEEVRAMIETYGATDIDRANILQVAQTSLFLTGTILENVFSEYEAMKKNDLVPGS